jgi:hypothetical protein
VFALLVFDLKCGQARDGLLWNYLSQLGYAGESFNWRSALANTQKSKILMLCPNDKRTRRILHGISTTF